MNIPRKVLPISLVTALAVLLVHAAAVVPPVSSAPQQDQPPQQQQAAPQQAPQPPPDSGSRIRTTVQLVLVPVTVKDERGALVGGITKDEFRVFEDGVEQKVSYFSADATPLSVVLLVDDDMKIRAAKQVQESLIAMAGGFSAADEVALTRFDEFLTPVMEFTSDNDQLVAELKRLDLGSSSRGQGTPVMPAGGPTNPIPTPGAPTGGPQVPIRALPGVHINDAVHAAAELLRSRPRDHRKIIILVSDGVNAKNNTYSYNDTLRLLLSSDISVYALGVDMDVLKRRTSVLADYARSTGGDVDYTGNGPDLMNLYAQVSEQARHEYTLGYVPGDTDRSKNYHSIEVRVRRSGLTLLTRDGYYQVARP